MPSAFSDTALRAQADAPLGLNFSSHWITRTGRPSSQLLVTAAAAAVTLAGSTGEGAPSGLLRFVIVTILTGVPLHFEPPPPDASALEPPDSELDVEPPHA